MPSQDIKEKFKKQWRARYGHCTTLQEVIVESTETRRRRRIGESNKLNGSTKNLKPRAKRKTK